MDLFSFLKQQLSPEKQLDHAIQTNNTEELVHILRSGVDADTKLQEEGGNRAIHCAARLGSDRCVQILIEAGANPDSKNDFGHTPFTLAVRGQSRKTVETLLRHCSIHVMWISNLMKGLAFDIHLFFSILRAIPNASALHLATREEICNMLMTNPTDDGLKMWVMTGNDFTTSEKLKIEAMQPNFNSWLAEYRKNACPLAHHCRLAIRKSMKDNVIRGAQTLPMPPVLQDYLCFRNDRYFPM